MISTIDGIASRASPKNSRHTVRLCRGMRCTTQRAAVMRPSQPSFCTPGRPPRNLSVTSLPSPALRNAAPGMVSVSVRSVRAVAAGARPSFQVRRQTTSGASWILPRLWPMRSTSSQSPCGSTMRHQARLSTAVPHSTAFLPPAFMATLPPTQQASIEVGSTANTKPARSAASATRFVTTPASEYTVGTVRPAAMPGSAMCSTSVTRSSFSVLMTAERGVRGIAPPV